VGMDSDERLYERLRGGDLLAFDLLYARYERRLFGFVFAYLKDRAEAEDVFHETFLGILRSREVSFSGGSFRSWIYQIARNDALNRLRKQSRWRRVAEAARGEPILLTDRSVSKIEPPDAGLAAREADAALGQAVSRLPVPLSEVYHLRASGLSYEEMARVLDLPLGTVKSRMHEMLTQLKKEMRPWTAR
jgi:RNA polymerase sigma-70 factor (ECF subfamily)